MIIAVCLNPALDITQHVPAVDWSGVNRPTAVHSRPGGKGVNVARTLHALGAEVLLLGLAGGPTGSAIKTALPALGVPTAFTPIAGDSRRTFTVVDGAGLDGSGGRNSVALFNEPGPEAVTVRELPTRHEPPLQDPPRNESLSGKPLPPQPARQQEEVR